MTKKQQLILKIMHLAYLVHETTKFCVFIEFSGHVNGLYVRIRESKKNWQVEVLGTEITESYMKHEKAGEALAYLTAKVEVLEHILREQEIPYEELDYEEEYVRHYTF